MIKLYHGTNLNSALNISSYGISLDKSLPYLDFGKGFYTTTDKSKAISRARKKTLDYNRINNCNDTSAIVELVLNDNKLLSVSYKYFEYRSIDWFEFVINNRLDTKYLSTHNIYNHNKDYKYDIVCGEIADGKIAYLVNEINQGRCNIADVDYNLIVPSNSQSYGEQYSFHTQKGLSCIESVKCAIIDGKVGD